MPHVSSLVLAISPIPVLCVALHRKGARNFFCEPFGLFPRSTASTMARTSSRYADISVVQQERKEWTLFEADGTGRVDVVVQLVSDVLNDFLCLHAIAGLIKPRRKHGNCPLARSHGDNPTAYTAL